MQAHWTGNTATRTAQMLAGKLRGRHDKVEHSDDDTHANAHDLASSKAAGDDARALAETLATRQAVVRDEVATYVADKRDELMSMEVTSAQVYGWVGKVEDHVEKWIAHLQGSWSGLEKDQFTTHAR